MATFDEKLARFEALKARVEFLVASGVDPKSLARVPAGWDMILAFDELAQEFGYNILKRSN